MPIKAKGVSREKRALSPLFDSGTLGMAVAKMARVHYQTARKFDFGRFTEALDQHLASLAAQ